MKFVILKERSDGNESVGSMWIDSYIFDGTATLNDVLFAVATKYTKSPSERDTREAARHGKIILTVAENEP